MKLNKIVMSIVSFTLAMGMGLSCSAQGVADKASLTSDELLAMLPQHIDLDEGEIVSHEAQIVGDYIVETVLVKPEASTYAIGGSVLDCIDYFYRQKQAGPRLVGTATVTAEFEFDNETKQTKTFPRSKKVVCDVIDSNAIEFTPGVVSSNRLPKPTGYCNGAYQYKEPSKSLFIDRTLKITCDYRGIYTQNGQIVWDR